MTIEEIRDLRDKLEPFSFAIGGIEIKFPFGTDALCLTAHPSTEERLHDMEAILAPYKDKFLRTDLLLQPDPAICRKYLERIDFLKFRQVLTAFLEAEIKELSKRANPEPIYAFGLAISPEHHNIAIFWNTLSRWEATEAEYRSKGYPLRSGFFPSAKYWAPNFGSNALVRDRAAFQQVNDCLAEQETVSGEFFDLTFGGGIFRHIYERRFTATAIHALRAAAERLGSVAVTQDFVYYVQDYCGNGDDLFTALETIPEAKLRTLFPETFARNEHES